MTRFSNNDIVILLIFLINVLAFSTVPVVNVLLSRSTLLIISIAIFLFIVNLGSRDLSRPFIRFNIFSIIGIIIAASFFISSFYFNLEYSLTLKAFTKLLLYPIIVFFFFYYFPFRLLENEYKFEKFLDMYVIFAVISSLIAFLFMYLEYYPGLVLEGHTLGFFYHSNSFAFVFTVAIPVVLYRYLSKRIPFVPFTFLMLLFSTCLLFTYSRAGFIGALTAITILLYKKSKVLMVAGILIILILGSSVITNFATAKGETSFFTRAQVMYVAYDMIFNHGSMRLLWGYGVINNVDVFQEIVTFMFGAHRTEMGPHNFFFSLGLQFGIILAVSCTLFVILLLIKAFLIKKSSVGVQHYQRINLSISIVLGLLVQCFFEDLIIYPEFFAMPLILIFSGYIYYSLYFR